jgi:hypothetical protein
VLGVVAVGAGVGQKLTPQTATLVVEAAAEEQEQICFLRLVFFHLKLA